MVQVTEPDFRKIDFHNHIWLHDGDDLGDRQVEDMDRYGVERMLVHACDEHIWTFTAGNEKIAAAVARHPDRYVGTVCLDFRDGVEKCIDLIRWAADHGLKGAKMFPNLGFYPDDPAYYPIYEELSRLHFFAAYHMGFLQLSDYDARIPMSTKYADPYCLEEVAIRFPDIRFVICHMGGVPWFDRALLVTLQYSNVYADLSLGYGVAAFQQMAKLGGLLWPVAWDKIMWGVDMWTQSSEKEWHWKENLEFWQKNAQELGYEEQLSKVFYENAKQFLSYYDGENAG